MEDSDDDIPLQVLVESAGRGDPTFGESGAVQTFTHKGMETPCPATPLATSASCTGRNNVFKASTGHIEHPNHLNAVADEKQLIRSASTDEANLNLCGKKTKAKKLKILEEGQRYNDMFSKEVRSRGRISGTRQQSELVSQ